MDLDYFEDQICDEFDGAEDYAKKAIENKVLYPDWSKTFNTMAEVEMDHAKNLYDMCAKYYQKITTSYNPEDIPSNIQNRWTSISLTYAENFAKVSALLKCYE